MPPVDLADYVPVLRREVTPPGTTLFSSLTDADFASYLLDGFWECKLDSLLDNWTTNSADFVVALDGSDVTFPREMVALVVLYAGIRFLRNHILNTGTGLRAHAGPVEFETTNSARVLTEMLQQLKDTKNRILAKEGELFGVKTVAGYIDAYAERQANSASYSGFLQGYNVDVGS